MGRSWRVLVFLLVAFIFFPVLMKRQNGIVSNHPNFLKYTTGHLLVRVVDTKGSQGIYRFYDGATVADVKKMTSGSSALDPLTREIMSKRLKNGDVVEFKGEADRIYGITLKPIAAAERIVLCIPLDPDIMSLDDWMALPGVGHFLAEAIVADRQKNGDFRSLERVSRVSGIGLTKIKSLEKYFVER